MLALLPLVALLAAQPASADREIGPDLKCVALFSFAVSQASAEQRGGLIAGTLYYVGRIDARRPGFDYAAELTALLRDQAQVNALPAEQARCAALLKDRGEVLQRAGAALKALGEKQGK